MSSEDQPMLQRQQTLRRYFRALEDGDIQALAAILHQAERDEALERALLALNDSYLDEAVSSAEGAAAWVQVEQALQGQEPSQNSQSPIDSEHGRGRFTMAEFADTNSNKHTEPRQQELTAIDIPAADLSPASLPAGNISRRNPSVISFVQSALAVAAVVLVLLGFIAVMTTRQSGGQSDGNTPAGGGTLTSTGVKATGNIVLVGSNGEITALRASDGAVIWQRKVTIPTRITSSQNIVTNIQVQNDVAYFTLDGGDLFAVHVSDGSLIWRKSFGLGLTSRLFVGGGLVVMYDFKGTHALQASDGAELWVLKDAMPFGIANGRVLVEKQAGSAMSLTAIGGESGKVLWTYDQVSSTVATVSANSTTVYAFLSGNEPGNTPPYVVALRLNDGSLLWRQASAYDDMMTTLTLGGQYVYLQVYGNRYICTYRLTDGVMVSCTGNLGPTETLAIVNGIVYASRNEQIGSTGALQVGTLDATHGTVQWLWNTPAIADGYNSNVLFQGNMILAAGATGMSAYRLSDGQQLWHALDSDKFVASLTIATLP